MATNSKERRFHQELLQQLVALSTSGFGLVAALAWNEAIQTFVKEYIQRFYPDQAGVVSKFLYAVIITVFAVFITYQLSRLSSKFNAGQKGFAPILVVLLIAVGIGGYFSYQQVNRNSSTPPLNQAACTQEAKLCPDGSSVGRVGPNCEFAPCPTSKESTSSAETTNWKTYTNVKFGYSLKYPTSGKITEGGVYSVDGVFVEHSNITSLLLADVQLGISVTQNKDNLTLEDLKKAEFGSFDRKDINLDWSGQMIQTTALSGIPAIIGDTSGVRGSRSVIAIYKDQIFQLRFEPDISLAGEQILYTFKFTDTNCYYEKVWCKKAPCEPVLRCSDQNTIVLAAKEDLAKQLNTDINSIKSGEVNEVEWSDAGLGCPKDGMIYAQVITPGYKIIFEYNDQEYEYHTDKRTNFVRCEDGRATN